jgi:MerR family transcriptional regulator, copper efflux regulator
MTSLEHCRAGATTREAAYEFISTRGQADMGDLQIGELARLFNLAPNVLRHWETMGLLAPDSRPSGRRRYQQEHVTRVAMIIRAQEAGLSLSDVRALLGSRDRASRRAVLKRHKAYLEARLAELHASKQMIEHALDCRHESLSACPAFQKAIQGVVERYARGLSSSANSECPAGKRLPDQKLARRRRPLSSRVG